MTQTTCTSCQQPLGTNGSCKTCLHYRMEQDSRNVSEQDVRENMENATRFQEDPPWYQRFMPQVLWNRFLLLLQLMKDLKQYVQYRGFDPAKYKL